MKKVIVFFADGFEEVEALTIVDVLRRADMKVDMVSVSGEKIVHGAHGINIETDVSIEDLSWGDYDACILPGGAPGYKNLADCKKVEEIATDMNKKEKLVAAICASPTVLGGYGLLKGKNACCYPGMEDGMKGAIPNTKDVNVDGNIITSRGVGTSIEFALTIVEYFYDRKTSEDLGETFVWTRP